MNQNITQAAARYLGGRPDPDAVMAAGRQAVGLDARVQETAQETALRMNAKDLAGFARSVAQASSHMVSELGRMSAPAAKTLHQVLAQPSSLAQAYPGISAMQRRAGAAQVDHQARGRISRDVLVGVAAAARRRVMVAASGAPAHTRALKAQVSTARHSIDSGLAQAIQGAKSPSAAQSMSAVRGRVVAALKTRTQAITDHFQHDVRHGDRQG